MDEEHDIGWAVQKMRDGYKVTRPEMRPAFLMLGSDGSYLVNEMATPQDRFRVEHVLATDWELAE